MTQKSKKQVFETCSCLTQMRSQNCHTLIHNKITPPEYLLMRHVHGANAVQFKGKTGGYFQVRVNEQGQWMRRAVSREDLIDRLLNKYGTANFRAVFPGADPVLPYTFDAINIEAHQPDTGDDDSDWELLPTAQAAIADAKASGDKILTPQGEVSLDDLDDDLEALTAPDVAPNTAKKGK